MNDIDALVEQWKNDPFSTYNTWFDWEERLKNFRSIRTGLLRVIEEIRTDQFGCSYRNSSLEALLRSVTEQKQIFKGADHAFIWKPKLRIPDIYEDSNNQLAFGRFLSACFDCCKNEHDLEKIIDELSNRKIKGLGPAVMNLLYFLHPTFAMPSNTAIQKGYNSLFESKIKLGSWNDYLTMRMNVHKFNERNLRHFSSDLGAVAGFLFDLGRASPGDNVLVNEKEVRHTPVRKAIKSEDDLDHTNVQGILRDIGLALGHQVWIASNDRNRSYNGGRLSENCLTELPAGWSSGALIDVLWLQGDKVVAAFEVEHSTSIYSGILRMLDLANSEIGEGLKGMYLVAPDKRASEVRAQLARPSFSLIKNLELRYLSYSNLSAEKDSIMKFGESLKALEKISTRL